MKGGTGGKGVGGVALCAKASNDLLIVSLCTRLINIGMLMLLTEKLSRKADSASLGVNIFRGREMHTTRACLDPPPTWQQLTRFQVIGLANPQVQSEDKCYSSAGSWATVV